MVSFETEVYSRQADDVIGVKVIVIADNGQTIDTIHVVNETDFQALKTRLDTLNEDYVKFADNSEIAGLTIDEVLANVSEVVAINATTLGGYQSDEFSKNGHTHLKRAITDLYNYNITLSKYNVNLVDLEPITVTVRVTNTNNSPVNNHEVVLYKQGVFWKTGRTNSNGVYTTNYTPDIEGLTVIAVNNQKVQLNAIYDTGWLDMDVSNVSSNFRVTDSFQVRRIGKTVHVKGTVRSSRTISIRNWEDYVDIGRFPNAQFAPSQDETFVIQSSSAQRCVAVINTNGIHVGRFTAAASGGVYTIPADLMIRVACTYFVD